MNGREDKKGYIINNSPKNRIVVPSRHSSVSPNILTNLKREQIKVEPQVATKVATPQAGAQPVQAPIGTQPIQMKPQIKKHDSGQLASPGAPYNQRHLPTSNPEPLIINNPTITFSSMPEKKDSNPSPVINTHEKPVINPPEKQAAKNSNANPKQAGLTEAQRKYHQAWQNYYQKYYENYYIAALQEQQARFAKQQAEVVDSREDDGKLSQAEVQQRLQSDIIKEAQEKPPKRKLPFWAWPLIIAIIVVLVFLFLQYNSVVAAKIAAFITPGNAETQTIIVGDGNNQPVSTSPRVIIPKINVNAPVTYGLTSLEESVVQTALQNGPINYPVAGASATPGQKGNTVILGHSSADVFAPGNYKFIFVQLNRLTAGDLFYLDYGTTRYTYRVTETKVIRPTEVSELAIGTDKPYATLVTCDPPGTIANRLLVIGEQASPDPDSANVTQNESEATSPDSITGKPKTVLENIFGG